MTSPLRLKAKFHGHDPDEDSWLGHIFIEHTEGVAGIAEAKRKLTEAKKLLKEKGYEPVIAKANIMDNDNERTLVINEEYIALVVKFKSAELDIDETMFITDVMQVARNLEI